MAFSGSHFITEDGGAPTAQFLQNSRGQIKEDKSTDVVLDPGSRPQTIWVMEESARGRDSTETLRCR